MLDKFLTFAIVLLANLLHVHEVQNTTFLKKAFIRLNNVDFLHQN